MLPIDIGVGGAIMLILVLPPIFFWCGLCRKRWKRQGQASGGTCPFLGGAATNRCRVCHTWVSDRAFHPTCSLTTQSTNGNVVTTTTTTEYGWNHCAGCQYVKGQALLIVFLLAMLILWGWAVVERVLAVTGLTHRDERIRFFNSTLYMLTVVMGLIGWATVLCTRKALLKWSCLPPFACCCASVPGGARAVKGSPTPVLEAAPGVIVHPNQAAPAVIVHAVPVTPSNHGVV